MIQVLGFKLHVVEFGVWGSGFEVGVQASTVKAEDEQKS